MMILNIFMLLEFWPKRAKFCIVFLISFGFTYDFQEITKDPKFLFKLASADQKFSPIRPVMTASASGAACAWATSITEHKFMKIF